LPKIGVADGGERVRYDGHVKRMFLDVFFDFRMHERPTLDMLHSRDVCKKIVLHNINLFPCKNGVVKLYQTRAQLSSVFA